MKDLIEKYFEGETSLEEEKLLKKYFQQSKIDADLEKFRPLFEFFESEKKIEMSATKIQHLKSRHSSSKIYRFAVAAATVGAFLVGGFIYQKNMAAEKQKIALEKLHKDSFDDPEQAKAEIQAALALVSKKLNKGQKNAQKGLKKVEIIQILNKNSKN